MSIKKSKIPGLSPKTSSVDIAFVETKEVGDRTRSGAIWSGAQIIVRNGMSLILTAILARILSPEDYGLMGMVATLTAFLQIFANMGLSWATVRSPELNQHHVSGLFWINLSVGSIAWAAMAAFSPLLASFYQEPALSTIAIVAGASFLLSGAAVQPMALLTRTMDFRSIAIVEILALFCGALVALSLAFSGAGYWALVAQLPVQEAVKLVLSLGPSGIRISAPRWTPGLGKMIRFGGLLVVSSFFIFLARNLDSVMIGKVWGAAELGYYNRAYFLMLLPSTLAAGVLSKVMVASLSNLQHDPDKFGGAYRRSLAMVAYIGTPMALGLALTASSAVPIIYGPGWDNVVILLTWLSLAGITQPIYNTNGWLFTAAGKAGVYLLVTFANTVILGTVFYLTVPKGTIALAQGYGITMGLLLPLPVLWMAHRAAGIAFQPSVRVLLPIAVLNVAMGCLVWCAGKGLTAVGSSDLVVFTAQIAVGLLCYVFLTPVLLPDMLDRDILPLLRSFRRGKSGKTQ